MSDGLSVSIRGEAVLARLQGMEDRLRTELRRAVTRLSITVQAAVKGDKLTGQVLHVRTGTLRRSINRKIEETQTSITATVGTNVRYAAIHEYGFDGIVGVRAHMRLQRPVRAHTRHMRLPARSFLRSTLAERTTEITETLREAAMRAVRL